MATAMFIRGGRIRTTYSFYDTAFLSTKLTRVGGWASVIFTFVLLFQLSFARTTLSHLANWGRSSDEALSTYFANVANWTLPVLNITKSVKFFRSTRGERLGIVLTNCNSSLSWLSTIDRCEGIRILVYEKCGKAATIPQHLLNCVEINYELDGHTVGWQYSTFFYYIVTHFHSLHPITWFLKQTSYSKKYFLKGHKRVSVQYFVDQILRDEQLSFASLVANQGCAKDAQKHLIRGCLYLPSLSNQLPYLRAIKREDSLKINNWCKPNPLLRHPRQQRVSCTNSQALDLRLMHACTLSKNLCDFISHFSDSACRDGWSTCINDNFVVSGKEIHMYTKDTYASLLSALSKGTATQSLLLGIFFEVSWNVIWGCQISEEQNGRIKCTFS